MNLNQLTYFATLARMEHYTKAAEMLAITQPSLSHAIAALEQELGTDLFEKQGRNIVLTKYGKIFLEYVEEALGILDNGVKKVKTVSGASKGTIDLGYIYTLGTKFVPDLVSGFLKEEGQSEVHFEFVVSNTSNIIAGLKEGRHDVAFCSRKEKEKSILFTPVAQEKLVVVMPKGHELAQKSEVDLKDTLSFPYIHFTETSGLRPVIDTLFRKIKGVPQTVYEIEEDGAMAGLVAAGFGVAVMPDIPVLQQMQVEVRPLKTPGYERYIYMAYMKERYMSPAVQNFIAYVKKKAD